MTFWGILGIFGGIFTDAEESFIFTLNILKKIFIYSVGVYFYYYYYIRYIYLNIIYILLYIALYKR
jgi:hypothetical protein